MRVFIYASTLYVFMYIYMLPCIYVYVYATMYKCLYIHLYTYAYVYIYICLCMYPYLQMYSCMYLFSIDFPYLIKLQIPPKPLVLILNYVLYLFYKICPVYC